MSARELLPDVVGALHKRARRSWSNRLNQSKAKAQEPRASPDSAVSLSNDTHLAPNPATGGDVIHANSQGHQENQSACKSQVVTRPLLPEHEESIDSFTQIAVPGPVQSAQRGGNDIHNPSTETHQASSSPQVQLAPEHPAASFDYFHHIFPPLPAHSPDLPASNDTNNEDTKLPRPILIPRVTPGPHAPFARCFPPSLLTALPAHRQVPKSDFLAFIDALNLVVRPHPLITTTEFLAMVVGSVPFDVAEAVGTAVELAAVGAHVAFTYKATGRFFAVMNERYFHPRGLHVKMIKTKRLRKEFGLDKKRDLEEEEEGEVMLIDEGQQQQQQEQRQQQDEQHQSPATTTTTDQKQKKKEEKKNKKKPKKKLQPLALPLTADTLELSCQERCLAFLETKCYAARLEFDNLPPPATFTLPPPSQSQDQSQSQPQTLSSTHDQDDKTPPRTEPQTAPLPTSAPSTSSPKPPMFQRLAAWRVKHILLKSEKEAKRQRRRAWKRHHEKGKPLREPWGERQRVGQLDWVFVQNLDEWEAQRGAKAARKQEAAEEKRRKRDARMENLGLRRVRTERTVR
ncbi:uncharacterized protein B0I36DRAFT_358972 [Microdochium trichocladiopsis]|uniref:Uncharacterized protein n=1 Tax=Microdochium trichocladiopsis TaxID=1682393 RepID=A0A9P8YE69_9PEZI|nr:uncharacterized protein B0I36DRAFT_358972 [Microdochium trichocladiopsis]KAH7037247.1 hypothetical protein B0I36DRAFT_358972 [Microdochium trichocladiopsis]